MPRWAGSWESRGREVTELILYKQKKTNNSFTPLNTKHTHTHTQGHPTLYPCALSSVKPLGLSHVGKCICVNIRYTGWWVDSLWRELMSCEKQKWLPARCPENRVSSDSGTLFETSFYVIVNKALVRNFERGPRIPTYPSGGFSATNSTCCLVSPWRWNMPSPHMKKKSEST